MDQIRQSMMKAVQELRSLAETTNDPLLKVRLVQQADQMELASQEQSQDETKSAPPPTDYSPEDPLGLPDSVARTSL